MGYRTTNDLKIVILLTILMVAGCTACVTRGLLPTSQITPTSCPFNWAYRPAPEALASFQKLFKDAGINVVYVSADAYGETGGPDCAFHMMQYDLKFLEISDSTVTSEDGLGRLAMKAIKVLSGQSGYIGMKISGTRVSVQVNFTESKAYALLDSKLDGKGFLEALKT